MDVLLTPTQLDTLYESNREYHEYSPEKWEQAICRAQVMKVVDARQAALDGPCPVGSVVECPWRNCDDEVACRICKASHFFAAVEQALRAVGGEG